MDSSYLMAVVFGIVAVVALGIFMKSALSFLREGTDETDQKPVEAAPVKSAPVKSVPVAPKAPVQTTKEPSVFSRGRRTAPSAGTAPSKAQPEPVKTPEAPQAAANPAEKSEVSPAAQAQAPVSGQAAEAQAPATPAPEEAKAAEAVSTVEQLQAQQESKSEGPAKNANLPPIKVQGPNGESDKRISEIQDIISKYVEGS